MPTTEQRFTGQATTGQATTGQTATEQVAAEYAASLTLPHLASRPGAPSAIPLRYGDTATRTLVGTLARHLEEVLAGGQEELFAEAPSYAAPESFSRKEVRHLVEQVRVRGSASERAAACLNLLLGGTPDIATITIEDFEENTHGLAGYYDESGALCAEALAPHADEVCWKRGGSPPEESLPESRPALTVYVGFMHARIVNYQRTLEALQQTWVHRPCWADPCWTAPSGKTEGRERCALAAEREDGKVALAPLTSAGRALWDCPLSAEQAAHLMAVCWCALDPLLPGWTPADTMDHIEGCHWIGWSDDTQRLDEFRYEITGADGYVTGYGDEDAEDGRYGEDLSYDELREMCEMCEGYFITSRAAEENLPRSLWKASEKKFSAPASWDRPPANKSGTRSLTERIYRAARRAGPLSKGLAERCCLPRGPHDGWYPSFGLLWCDGAGGMGAEMFEEAMQYHAECSEWQPPETGLFLEMQSAPEQDCRRLLGLAGELRQALSAAGTLLALIDPRCTSPEKHAEKLFRKFGQPLGRPEEGREPDIASLPAWLRQRDEETAQWHKAARWAARRAGGADDRMRTRRGEGERRPVPGSCVPLLY